jgi:FkbM family methyltransferase
VIDYTIKKAKLNRLRLIDIGANIGDSLAQFRRFSSAPVTCVEPSAHFYSFLQRNAAQFGDVKLVNKLFAPTALVGKLSFISGNQTGFSFVTEKDQDADRWRGEYVSCDELFEDMDQTYIVKTDTDGFDCHIVLEIMNYISFNDRKVPVLFFEGPSAEQVRLRDMSVWLRAFAVLQERGYCLLLLRNDGMPYVYAGRSLDVARSALTALAIGYAHNRAPCHYYDVIAVEESVVNDVVTLSSNWDDTLFRRDEAA